MTLDRPLLLVALLTLPVLYLLARSLRERRTVPVSSLLIWSRLDLAGDPPRDLARRADRLLLLRLAAAGIVALGLSGPRLTAGDPEPVVDVLIDASPSMTAFRGGVEQALDSIREHAPPGAELRVTKAPLKGGLPAVLTRPGRGDVVVLTDQPPPGLVGGGRVRLYLVGEPVDNVGITSAWLTSERFGVVVESFATARRELSVSHPGGTVHLTLGPGESQVLEGAAPGGRAEITLLPGDRFDFDDRVLLIATPPVTVSLAWRGEEEPALELALGISGVTFDASAAGSLCYRTTPRPDARLIVAPPGRRRTVDDRSVAAAGGLPAEVCPPPGIALGSASIVTVGGGVVLLSDRHGPLAFVKGKLVTLALDPGDPESLWRRHPSFPVFVSELARLLGARPAGFEVREGVIDPAESATQPVARTPDLSGLRVGVASKPEPDIRLGGLLYGLAGVLLLAHFLLEARGRALNLVSRSR